MNTLRISNPFNIDFFFFKDSVDQQSRLEFAEWNAKSFLSSKIRFWIRRKEHMHALSISVNRSTSRAFV